MSEQSLKSVYAKVVSIIHPDREQDKSKKIAKTDMLQKANAAYESKDLFYLLKLQSDLDQDRAVTKKGMSSEQFEFYIHALDAQSQKLANEIDLILESVSWTKNMKLSEIHKGQSKVRISALYKQIDADTSAIKKQFKLESKRLKYMSQLSGLEELLEFGIL